MKNFLIHIPHSSQKLQDIFCKRPKNKIFNDRNK